MRRACALALVFAASCSKCGAPKSAASAEELLGANPSAAVVTSPLGALAQHFAALSDRVAQLPGGEVLVDFRKGLAAQLGFDPLTREGLLSAGLDPDRGAALEILEAQPRPEWVVALPLTKPDLWAQTVQRLMVERFGAAPGPQPQTFERAGTTIAWRVVRGYGMIARGANATALVNPPETGTTLARAPGLQAARQKLGPQDLIVWAPAGSALPRRYTSRVLPGDVSVSLQGAPQGLSARLLAQLPPADGAKAREALPGGGAALIELVPANAPLRMRLGVSPAKLLEFARQDARAAALIEQLRISPDLFAALQPGAVISLGVEKNASLAQAVDYGLDWRRKSPFDTMQLVALAQVADRPRFLKALEALAKSLPEVGARVAREGDDFEVTSAAGKGPRFGVREIEGKPVAYLLGGELTPADLHRTPKSANPEGAALYDDPGLALRADFGKLAAEVHALPETTYGTGPQSYVTRSVVGQVIDPLKSLRLTLTVQAQPDSLGANLDVEIVGP